MSKKYVSVLKDSAATPGYRIIAPEDYVYTENGTKKVKKIDSKADKKVPATAGNLATLDSTGNLADSGKQTTDFMNALTTAYEASGSATKTVTKVTQAKTGAVTVTYSDIQSGTTSQKGLVQLENSTSSTSTTTAATPNSVKSAYDLANGKYSKPSGGIPSSDLDSTVQASLSKADTAIQGVKLNGSTLTPSSAKVVDLGNLKTKQTAVSDPSASGTTITAIATISQNANGVITATKKTIQSASQSQDGVMSAADKTKLDGIATGAEVNQNAFSNVKVGDVTVAADAKTDTLTLAAGSNVTITPDATNDKITIAAKDTTYTADAGIRLDGTVFKHTNSVSGGTVGPTTDTAGATLSVPYVTYDSQGHVTASGTRTHNVGTASTSGAGIVQLQDSIDATTTKAATPNAVKKAIEALDVSSVGGSGKYISAISETDGKISATSTTMDTTPTASSEKAVTSGGIKTALDGKQNTLPTTGTASSTYAINISGTSETSKKWRGEINGIMTSASTKRYVYLGRKQKTTYGCLIGIVTVCSHTDSKDVYIIGSGWSSSNFGDGATVQRISSGGTNSTIKICLYNHEVTENGTTYSELWCYIPTSSGECDFVFRELFNHNNVVKLTSSITTRAAADFTGTLTKCAYSDSRSIGYIPTNTAEGSTSIPVYVKSSGEIAPCTDDFVHDGDVTSTYSSTGTAPVNGTAVASAISRKVTQFSLGSTGNSIVYTTFAKFDIANEYGHGEAQIILSSGGNYAGVDMGTWLITMSNRGSTAATPKASMTVRCLNQVSYDPYKPEFGYYYDTTNAKICFGVKSTAFRGNNTITILSTTGYPIEDFGDVTTAPSGWTPVSITVYSETTHTHGNIQSGGTLQTTDVAIASGDKLVVTDSSDSSKVARTSLSFDGSTASKALTQKGTFENVMLQADAMTVAGGAGVDVTYSGSTVTFAANIPSIPISTIQALSL